jgi:hypothetical protein
MGKAGVRALESDEVCGRTRRSPLFDNASDIQFSSFLTEP